MEVDGTGTPCEQDGNPSDSQVQGYSEPNLPEDIWYHMHSLMPMQDAAQFACVARAFVCSWRCRPCLDLSEQTFGNGYRKYGSARDFNRKVDHILKNHSGIGVKAFKFNVPPVYDEDSVHLDRLDSWLQIAVKPGIKELRLILTADKKYNFPCSLLSGETGATLQYLSLAFCHFHPTVKLGCFRSLTKLQLSMVHITASELGWLLSNSLALELLKLRNCNSINCLKIPCLQRLSYLEVICCTGLKEIESKAPNISSVWVAGDPHVQLSLENTCHIKTLNMDCSNFAFYARTNLPSIMPNLEALSVRSYTEMVNTPMVPSKFLHLKSLSIAVGGLTFDFLSLASFLDASPSLQTFILEIFREFKERVSVFEDHSDMRIMPGHHHSKLKHVKIIKFSAAKSLAELTCHILESATSLECLTLDTTHGMPRCSVNRTGKCSFMLKEAVVEAQKGVLVAQAFIKPKVPPTVEFNVLEPCTWCHDVGSYF
ncbi:unnamed protein product [Urochloa decumbens]|uniref:At1g61320/AtMIF1 LRR domain-containing protein n=1 Tax=Urochloa decumbens TaxID=240449 RepID=A0ABC8V7B5_9POAL